MDEGRYSRGYLPHVEAPGVPQFVSWRLADALPEAAILRLRTEVEDLPEGERKRELARRTEAYCDAGHGACPLRDPRAARICQETLFAHHARLYRLRAWVVVPNHVHALLTMEPGIDLAKAMHQIKGASAHGINRLLGRSGRLWQPESFDRWIRDASHFAGVVKYVEWNPVKAGLCRDPKLYPWSSAGDDAWARLRVVSQDESCGPWAG